MIRKIIFTLCIMQTALANVSPHQLYIPHLADGRQNPLEGWVSPVTSQFKAELAAKAHQLWQRLSEAGLPDLAEEDAVNPDLTRLYAKHLPIVIARYQEVISKYDLDYIVIPSGALRSNYEQDTEMPFQPFRTFLHLVPESSPNHYILISKDKAELFYDQHRSGWYNTKEASETFWASYWGDNLTVFDKLEGPLEAVVDRVAESRRIFIPSEATVIRKALIKKFAGKPDVPRPLRYSEKSFKSLGIDIGRTRYIKTPYEVMQMIRAQTRAVTGHVVVQSILEYTKGLVSPHILNLKYQEVTAQELGQMPYNTIIAANKEGSTLHLVEHSPVIEKINNLTIDAGVSEFLVSDITRTLAFDDDKVHLVYRALLSDLAQVQRELADYVDIGISLRPKFVIEVRQDPESGKKKKVKLHLVSQNINFHSKSVALVGEILERNGIIINASELNQSQYERIVAVFYPHSAGHTLGLAVHDTGNRDPNSVIVPGYAFTNEPGIYFRPVFLDRVRNDEIISKYIDWTLVDELIPFGGMRIETDMIGTNSGVIDLTQPFLESYKILLNR